MGEPEGVALFFKREKFHLEEIKSLHLNDLAAHSFKQTEIPKFAEVVLLATLRHKPSNNLLVVGKCMCLVFVKVKSTFEPSGPSGQSLLRVL